MRAEAAHRPDAAAGPLGIIACAGALPLEIADRASATGRGVHIVGIDGFASPEIARHPHDWANLGQVGRMIASLKRAGCRDLVIAGALRRPNLWRLKVDAGFLRSVRTVLRMTRGGDDSVLRLIVRFFEREGFNVVGVEAVAPELLAATGPMGAQAAGAEAQAAIARAARLIAALGPLDAGQAVVATAERVIAIEGARGTDAMLEDIAASRPDLADRRAVLVKLPKPGQELRIDLPTIGPRTVEQAAGAGLAGIALASGQSLIVERAHTLALADERGLFVTGIARSPACVPPERLDAPGLHPGGRYHPAAREQRDIALACRVLDVLAAHDAGTSVVVAGEHVLGTAVAGGLARLLQATKPGSHWGLRLVKRRIGVAAVRNARELGHGDGVALVLAAAVKAGLAGIAVAEPVREDAMGPLVGEADRRGLFVVAPRPGAAGSGAS